MEFSRSRKRDRHEYTASVVDIAEVPAYHQSEKQIEQVLQMLDELPETERLAIQLFYLDGHNADLTAELLGMSRSNVYATVKRACGRLANAIPTLMRGGEKS